jgi:hypothetical protein
MLRKYEFSIVGIDLLVLWYLERDFDHTNSVVIIDSVYVNDPKNGANKHIDTAPDILHLIKDEILIQIETEIEETLP